MFDLQESPEDIFPIQQQTSFVEVLLELAERNLLVKYHLLQLVIELWQFWSFLQAVLLLWIFALLPVLVQLPVCSHFFLQHQRFAPLQFLIIHVMQYFSILLNFATKANFGTHWRLRCIFHFKIHLSWMAPSLWQFNVVFLFNLSLKPVWPSLVPIYELNVATEERSNRTLFLNFIKELRNDGAYFE